MNPKIVEIESLLATGFDVEEITSDSDAVEIILTRGTSTRVVALDRNDASEILWGGALEARREVTAAH